MPGPGPFYFAWTGGAIEEQVTLVTIGSTHGTAPEVVTLIGDGVDQQLINLVSAQNLEQGALYELDGPGVTAGTFFVYDNSILSGPPDSIALSVPLFPGGTDETFEATKATIVGTVAGTLGQGGSAIMLAGITLAPGIYGIAGTGIGETDTPIPQFSSSTGQTTTSGQTPVMLIGSAYMVWDGSLGSMFILAATPHHQLGTDTTSGQQTDIVTYQVAAQDVRAVTSGTFPIQISGFPTEDPFSVTGIPTGALGALTPGLVYNISGNGIAIGSTFVAESGATSLEMDQPASAATIGAALTITGPRTPNEPFDPVLHAREDEDIVDVELDHQEGNFATLALGIKNPGVGLLAIGRQLWCWFSFDVAWTPEGTNAPDIRPLFNGRLIGSPRLQAREIVQLQFLARPDDFAIQKELLSRSLQVLPHYDRVWLAANPTPDTVLETYSALWHVDPTTLAVTTSDILEGEAGIIEIGEDQAFYEAFNLSYGQPPLVAVPVSGTVTWQQQAEGFIDVTPNVVAAFKDAGSPFQSAFQASSFSFWSGSSVLSQVGSVNATGGLISCLCGDGLLKDWPKPGTNIGGGWSLTTLNDSNGIPLCYIIDATKSGGGWLQNQFYNVTYAGQDQTFTSGSTATTEQSNVGVYTQPYGQFGVSFPVNVYKCRMTLQYRANRRRTETVTAVVTAAVQRVLSDSSEQDREGIALSSQYVGQGVDPGGAIPIGTLARRSYFQTDRGAQSFEYLLLLARAKMRARSRAVDIEFAVDWLTALGITLLHSVRYTDRRVPGGVALGKVKALKLRLSGGRQYGEFKIGCAIGTGASLAIDPSIGAYVEDGYVEDGYQATTGQTAIGSDIGYQPLTDFAILDDGLDLTKLTAADAVNECVVTNGLSNQVGTLSTFQHTVAPTIGSPVAAMNTLKTTVTLDCKPVAGAGAEFHADFFPSVTELALPKMIDLSESQG